jgi:hypothetical protein
MPNANNKSIVRLYGITLASPEFRTQPYGHGSEPFLGGDRAQYVDYFIEHIIKMSVAQNKFNDLYNACREQYKLLN